MKKVSENINSKRVSVNIKLKSLRKHEKILGEKNCSKFSEVLRFVFKLYILAKMTDICPIVVDIQIFRFESNFQIENLMVQVSPFFSLGRTAVSESVLQIISFCQFFFFSQSFQKKSKFLVSLFLPL